MRSSTRCASTLRCWRSSSPTMRRWSACEALAPDLSARLRALAQPVEPSIFAQLAPLPPPTGVIALAERRSVDPAAVLADSRGAPVILLEDPRDLGNMGACVRVAAAADAAGVLTTGSHDPWHPDALRGAAGLHYALPVARLQEIPAQLGRPLLAIDPEGEPLAPAALPPRAVLAFGTERYGLSEELSAPRRRAGQHPDAPGGLQPEPRDVGRRRPVRLAAVPVRLSPARPDCGPHHERLAYADGALQPRRAGASSPTTPRVPARASCRPAPRRRRARRAALRSALRRRGRAPRRAAREP